MDQFLADGGAEAILQMTNFPLPEFNGLWELIQAHASTQWNVYRGKKSSFKEKDVLFMMFTVLKLGGHSDFLAKMFNGVLRPEGDLRNKKLPAICSY